MGDVVAGALSLDLRKRVVMAYEAGEGTMKSLGRRFSVGEATVKRWVRRKRQGLGLEPGPYRGKEPRIGGERLAIVQAIVEESPDETREVDAPNRCSIRKSMAFTRPASWLASSAKAFATMP